MPPREVVAVGGAGGRLVEAGTRHCSREGLVLVLVGFRCGTFSVSWHCKPVWLGVTLSHRLVLCASRFCPPSSPAGRAQFDFHSYQGVVVARLSAHTQSDLCITVGLHVCHRVGLEQLRRH